MFIWTGWQPLLVLSEKYWTKRASKTDRKKNEQARSVAFHGYALMIYICAPERSRKKRKKAKFTSQKMRNKGIFQRIKCIILQILFMNEKCFNPFGWGFQIDFISVCLPFCCSYCSDQANEWAHLHAHARIHTHTHVCIQNESWDCPLVLRLTVRLSKHIHLFHSLKMRFFCSRSCLQIIFFVAFKNSIKM